MLLLVMLLAQVKKHQNGYRREHKTAVETEPLYQSGLQEREGQVRLQQGCGNVCMPSQACGNPESSPRKEELLKKSSHHLLL